MITARRIAAGLAVAGCASVFAAVGLESWPLVLCWLAAAGVIGLIWSRVPPVLRLALALPLLPLCVLLTFEGGLFFVPSVIALIVASVATRHSATA